MTGLFDIAATYVKGDTALCGLDLYVFDPHEKQSQFSTGIYPLDGNGWKPKNQCKDELFNWIPGITLKEGEIFTYNGVQYIAGSTPDSSLLEMDEQGKKDQEFIQSIFDLEPNVLECKDKMINEI